MTRLVSATTLVALTTSLIACHRGEGDIDFAEIAADSTSVSQAEASLLASAIEGAEAPPAAAAPVTAASAASFITAHAPLRYSPSGCAVATQRDTTVTLAFTGCTGPRGLRALDGTLTLGVSSARASAITVTAAATDFQIGQATLDLDATATYATTGSTTTLTVETHSAGVGPLGRAIAHGGAYTASWTATCVAIDGAWSTEIGEAGRSTTAELTRCLDACPTGSVERTTFGQRVIALAFDGTDLARWTSSGGRDGSFRLACGL